MGSALVGALPHPVAGILQPDLGEGTDSGAHRVERDGSTAMSWFTAASSQQLHKHEQTADREARTLETGRRDDSLSPDQASRSQLSAPDTVLHG